MEKEEQHRHACEVRSLGRLWYGMKGILGKELADKWLKSHYKLVKEKRGKLAADHLERSVNDFFRTDGLILVRQEVDVDLTACTFKVLPNRSVFAIRDNAPVWQEMVPQ